jgi:inosine-uridine nucleoside N-ribohydrolase
MKDAKPVLIDCDPGVDDAAAIFLALSHKSLDIQAITTVFGNVGLEQTTTNALKILEIAGNSDIAVFKGAEKTFDYRDPIDSKNIHGVDGLGNNFFSEPPSDQLRDEHAALATIDIANKLEGELTYIALGRLTNLALAISLQPSLVNSIKEVVVMGGAINVPGNISPTASANLFGDVQGASVVYRSGINLTQIGLDVCNEVEISPANQEDIWKLDTKVSRFLKKIITVHRNAYQTEQIGTKISGAARFNDMPTIGYTIDPTLFECETLRIHFETLGEFTRGQTVSDPKHFVEDAQNVNVALKVKSEKLVQLWMNGIKSYL